MIDRGRRIAIAVGLLLAVVAATALSIWSLDAGKPGAADGQRRTSQNGVVSFLTGQSSGTFETVTRGAELRFPRDHGPHPGFRQEWWYFTGNVATDAGRRFGFQLTFFRFAHDAFDAYRESSWNNEQSWMAHFAVSDLEGGRFVAVQDYARGALQLAGASAEPFRVWVNGWSAAAATGNGGRRFQARLSAVADDISIGLDVFTDDPPLLQGDAGYSVKDEDALTASYYYSQPDLAANGTIGIAGQKFQVRGRAWMDREWSTAVLTKGQSGWDWFALRMNDGSILMLFQVREEAGGGYRYAMYRDRLGRVRRFENRDIDAQGDRWWTSARTGSKYPLRWRVTIPPAGIDVTVQAALEDQELDLDFSYWEGVVDVAGTVDNEDVQGEGYLELTGY
jgi:predicted secreted hydrolase